MLVPAAVERGGQLTFRLNLRSMGTGIRIYLDDSHVELRVDWPRSSRCLCQRKDKKKAARCEKLYYAAVKSSCAAQPPRQLGHFDRPTREKDSGRGRWAESEECNE